MLLSLNEKNKTKKKLEKMQKKQTNKNSLSSLRLEHRWRCYQAIAQNDQHGGPTSLAPLSPYLNDAKQ